MRDSTWAMILSMILFIQIPDKFLRRAQQVFRYCDAGLRYCEWVGTRIFKFCRSRRYAGSR